MQAMKAREVEHVRWRAARPPARDPEVQGDLHAMFSDARQALESRVDLAELAGSACVSPAAFLQARHKESLVVTKLKQETPEGEKLRGEHCELFTRFPPSTLVKVGEAQLSTALGQARGVVQLAAKHSGEVVELDRNKMSWVLHSLAPGSASAEWSPQWRCAENGQPPECTRDLEYGYPRAQDSFRKMNSEVERVLREDPDLSIDGDADVGVVGSGACRH